MTKNKKFVIIILMKNKLFFTLIFVIAFAFLSFPTNIYSIPTEVKITLSKTNIYESASIESSVIGTAHYGEKFVVQNKDGDFYQIDYAETTGYILIAYTIDSEQKSLKINLDTNAVLASSAQVFTFDNGKYVSFNDLTLKSGTRVKLVDGLDSSKEYARISFEYDGEIQTMYVLSKTINPDGINTRTLSAIMLIIASVSIFLILYSFFRGKKEKIKIKR